MTVLQTNALRAMESLTTIKDCMTKNEKGNFDKKIIEMDATLNQMLQFLDEELQSTHRIRRIAVDFYDHLLKCREVVKHDSGVTIKSNFDPLEEHLTEAIKMILIFEYELSRFRPDSILLQQS